MNLSNQIQKWLDDDGFYTIGVNLLLQTGAKVHIFQHYISAPWVPADIEQRLRFQLVAFLEDNPPEEEPITLSKKQPEVKPESIETALPIIVKEEPIEVQQLRLLAKAYIKSMTISKRN